MPGCCHHLSVVYGIAMTKADFLAEFEYGGHNSEDEYDFYDSFCKVYNEQAIIVFPVDGHHFPALPTDRLVLGFELESITFPKRPYQDCDEYVALDPDITTTLQQYKPFFEKYEWDYGCIATIHCIMGGCRCCT